VQQAGMGGKQQRTPICEHTATLYPIQLSPATSARHRSQKDVQLSKPGRSCATAATAAATTAAVAGLTPVVLRFAVVCRGPRVLRLQKREAALDPAAATVALAAAAAPTVVVVVAAVGTITARGLGPSAAANGRQLLRSHAQPAVSRHLRCVGSRHYGNAKATAQERGANSTAQGQSDTASRSSGARAGACHSTHTLTCATQAHSTTPCGPPHPHTSKRIFSSTCRTCRWIASSGCRGKCECNVDSISRIESVVVDA
jgi:hypothetical protein